LGGTHCGVFCCAEIVPPVLPFYLVKPFSFLFAACCLPLTYPPFLGFPTHSNLSWGFCFVLPLRGSIAGDFVIIHPIPWSVCSSRCLHPRRVFSCALLLCLAYITPSLCKGVDYWFLICYLGGLVHICLSCRVLHGNGWLGRVWAGRES
jgi:hypothetical protein